MLREGLPLFTLTVFDPAAYLNVISQVLSGNPGLILRSPVESGSWAVYTNFYQSVWVGDGLSPSG